MFGLFILVMIPNWSEWNIAKSEMSNNQHEIGLLVSH